MDDGVHVAVGVAFVRMLLWWWTDGMGWMRVLNVAVGEDVVCEDGVCGNHHQHQYVPLSTWHNSLLSSLTVI